MIPGARTTTSTPVYSHAGNKIDPLTSFRFFAAMYVVLYHTLVNVYTPTSTFWKTLLDNGPVAVSFFFILSGYILTTVYCRYDHNIDRPKFWAARFARVYPLFFVALVLDTPFLLAYRVAKYGVLAGIAKTAISFGAGMAMLQAWFIGFSGINHPSWSLSVEAFFYLLFPFIAVGLWRLRQRTALVLLPLLCAAGGVLVWSATRAGLSEFAVTRGPIFHLYEFVFGILVARVHSSLADTEAGQARLRRISPWLLTFGFVACLVVINFTSEPRMRVVHDGLLTFAFGIIILALACGNKIVVALFSPRWLVVLGEASYGLYLLHVPVVHYVEKTGIMHSWIGYVFYICAAVGASVASYYWLETPARKKIISMFERRRRLQKASTPEPVVQPVAAASAE